MNWTEIIVGTVGAVVGLAAGAALGPLLKGKPPAPKTTWDDIDAKIDAERKAKK